MKLPRDSYFVQRFVLIRKKKKIDSLDFFQVTEECEFKNCMKY